MNKPFNPEVSLLGPLTGSRIGHKPLKNEPILSILKEIKSGVHKSSIEALRSSEPGSREFDSYKKGLWSFTASGKFELHKSIKGKTPVYSGLGQIDLDFKGNEKWFRSEKEVNEWRDRLVTDPHVFAAFQSPSGNGVKLLFRCPEGPDQHKQYMGKVCEYISRKYELIVDPVNDIQRRCFYSYDPGLKVNESAIPLDFSVKDDIDLRELEFFRDPIEGIDVVQASEILSFLDPDMPEPKWRRVLCGLKHQFQSSLEDGFRLFHDWSSSGISKYKGERDCREKWNAANANTVDRDPVTFRSIVKMAESEGYRKLPTLPDIISVDELRDSAPDRPEELIEGLLFQGRKMIIAALSKGRKTWMNLDLAVSIATGGAWLQFNTKRSRVLYLDFELGDYEFVSRLNRILHAKEIDSVEKLWRWGLRGQTLNLDRLLPNIRRFTRKNNIGLIVIDPLYAALQGRDENSNSEMTDLMMELELIAKQTDAAISIVHHFTKGDPSGKLAQDRMSGAGSLARAADAIVTLTPHKSDSEVTPRVVADFITRSFEQPRSVVLDWVFPMWYPNVSEDPAHLKTKRGRKPEYSIKELVEVLAGNSLTYTEFRKQAEQECGIKGTTFKRLVNEARESGVIVKDGKVYTTLL